MAIGPDVYGGFQGPGKGGLATPAAGNLFKNVSAGVAGNMPPSQGAPQGPPGSPQGPVSPSGGYANWMDAPGTSGAIAHVFKEQAEQYKMDREETEARREDRRAGMIQSVSSAGNMAIRQAELADAQKKLQIEQAYEGGALDHYTYDQTTGQFDTVAGDFEVKGPREGFKGQMQDLFSDKANIGLKQDKAGQLTQGSYSDFQDFTGTDAFKASGMDKTQLGTDLGWKEHMSAAEGTDLSTFQRGDLSTEFQDIADKFSGSNMNAQNAIPSANDPNQSGTAGGVGGKVTQAVGKKIVNKQAGNILSGKGGNVTDIVKTIDTTGKVGSGLATAGKVAGGVGGAVQVGSGINRMASSETARGKVGGAIEAAGGLASGAAALGLAAGPIGWVGLGAGMLGGLLRD